MNRGIFAATLALTALAGCGTPANPRSAAPSATSVTSASARVTGDEQVGRWVVWAGARRTWGSFITAKGSGPLWPLDVAGNPRWSDDGRWLTSCAAGFVAARWMGGARPSRIVVANGDCEKLAWAPRGDRALVLSRGSTQARLLSLTPGEPPSIVATPFEPAFPGGEKTPTWTYSSWSPTGDSLLITVAAPGRTGSSLRWVDARRKPGAVQQLATADGFQADGRCWWAPNGKHIACESSHPVQGAPPTEARTALASFELSDDGRVSGRIVFESHWFALQALSWLDADRLVFQDRDATRLLDITSAQPPITLSASANDFAVSPTAPRVAYVNHRGLCLRDAGAVLGPERVLAPGSWTGVQWSAGGRHVLTRRPDQRAALVVVDAGGERPNAHQTTEAPAGFSLGASFSAGETMLFTRPVVDDFRGNQAQPLKIWSLAPFGSRPLLPEGFSDRWLSDSADDAALITQRADSPGSLFVGLMGNGEVTLRALGEAAPAPQIRWQPGRAIAAGEIPALAAATDAARERVTLAPTHSISLGTAYVRGARECSGALIDPMYVVTAQHCVDGARGSVQVVLGRGLDWEREYSVPAYRVLQHPKVRRIERLDLLEYDLALIELPEAAPAAARPLPLARADEGAPGSEIYLAGYGGDHWRGLGAQPELRYGTSRLVVADPAIAGALAWRSVDGADNAGCFGDSGGPVLLRRSDGSFALLAIHFGSGGTDYTLACGRDGIGGNLAAERAWLDDAADQLALSRRGSGPPRPRATRF